MSTEKQKFNSEFEALIELGQRVKSYFYIEMCDPYGGQYGYLASLSEDEWDDEDRENAGEYEKLKIQVEDLRNELSKLGSVSAVYQTFYTQGFRLVSAIAPERASDFEGLYKRKSGGLKGLEDYTISDGFRRIQRYDEVYSPKTALGLIQSQIDILIAIRDSLGSSLFEIEQTLRMDLFDTEIEGARHLKSRGHLRAAGALLGVILEGHLKSVSQQHGFVTRKKAASIADYNEFLKAEELIDTVGWR
ncbi:hypothetical protein [Tateyamaria sp.]|uniref:hypothetical protein n=1 Tax=Tateyamaria sp. TaxID=1929288 RepID=UPI0032A022C4